MFLDAVTKFDESWALLTAGTAESFNAMTVSWGGLGTLWSKPVATVYVRPSRYTFSFMEKNDVFTVSFFPESYRKDLGVLGARSGRDGDKIALTRLTPVSVAGGMTFQEAEITLVLKKLYAHAMDPAHMPADVADNYYRDGDVHHMFIGEVLEILR